MKKARSLAPRIGILSTLTAPLLPRLLQNLFNVGVDSICVLLDEKLIGDKDRRIWQQRTESAFDGGPSLYDFTQHGLAIYPVKSHNSDDCIGLIQQLGLSLLINGGTPRKLNKAVLQSIPQGVINVHPGLLPKYRGASCVEWAIYNDERVGNTAHFMTEGYDEGPIIISESYEFTPNDTYASIRTKVYRESLRLMAETVKVVFTQGLTISDYQQQGAGELFAPISEEKMQFVLEKVANKSYRYMGKNYV